MEEPTHVASSAWLTTFGVAPLPTRKSGCQHKCSVSIIAAKVVLSGVAAVAGSLLVILVVPHSEFRRKTRLRVVIAVIEVLIFAPLRLAGTVFQVDIPIKQWCGTGIILTKKIQ
jgi:hypothetical protein